MATITATYKMEVPGTDLTFEPQGPLPESHDEVWVRSIADDDDVVCGYDVSWLVRDEDCWDGFEWDQPTTTPSEWINGCFRDFRNSRDGGGQESRDEFITEMAAKVGQDRVFIVDVYSHGLEHFSVSNSRWYPDRQWDVAPACVLVVPPDVTNPREWADGVMEQYTSWACGDTWLVVTNTLDTEGHVTNDECVGGFIGRENAEEAARCGY